MTAWEGQDTQEPESPPHLVTEPHSVSLPLMWLSPAKYKLECAFSSLLSGFWLDTSLKETRSKQSVGEMELGGLQKEKAALHPLCPWPRSPFCWPVSLKAALRQGLGWKRGPRGVVPCSAAAVQAVSDVCLAESALKTHFSQQTHAEGAPACVVT